jgi:ribosomal protein L17
MARKLSRKFQARKRLIRNQLSSLVLSGKVVTTSSKAKLLKSETQKMISVLKKLEGINRTRMIHGLLYGGAIKKMDNEFDSYQKVMLYKLNSRKGDGAALSQVVIEKIDSKQAKIKEVKAVK